MNKIKQILVNHNYDYVLSKQGIYYVIIPVTNGRDQTEIGAMLPCPTPKQTLINIGY